MGTITRGTTNPNRLRRHDRWLLARHRRVVTGGAAPTLVDLGYGAAGTTSAEWHDRVLLLRPDVEVVGLEIDPERVRAAQPLARPGLRFARGGFEVPLPGGRSARVIRAFNVLRQYDESEVAAAWALLRGRLEPGGLLVDGTCDELGRLGAWVALDPSGPQTLTLSWRLADLTPERPPSVVAERLPKALIHRNVPGERVHTLLNDLDDAWRRAAPFAPYGPRHRFVEAVGELSRTHAVSDGRSRWRLGELTVPWSAVAPRVDLPSADPPRADRGSAGQRA